MMRGGYESEERSPKLSLDPKCSRPGDGNINCRGPFEPGAGKSGHRLAGTACWIRSLHDFFAGWTAARDGERRQNQQTLASLRRRLAADDHAMQRRRLSRIDVRVLLA